MYPYTCVQLPSIFIINISLIDLFFTWYVHNQPEILENEKEKIKNCSYICIILLKKNFFVSFFLSNSEVGEKDQAYKMCFFSSDCTYGRYYQFRLEDDINHIFILVENFLNKYFSLKYDVNSEKHVCKSSTFWISKQDSWFCWYFNIY